MGSLRCASAHFQPTRGRPPGRHAAVQQNSKIGKPAPNAFIERFNRTYREEVLNAYLFHSAQEAQQLSDAWLVDYHERRPHDALGRLPPLTLLPRFNPAGVHELVVRLTGERTR